MEQDYTRVFPHVSWDPLPLLDVLSAAAGRFGGLGSEEEKGRETNTS